MEVKIIISDAGAAAAQSGASVQISVGEGAAPGSPPAEVLRQAVATGAFNAGPAPDFTGMAQSGVPQPFITARAAQVYPGGVLSGTSPDESAGPAPGSGVVMESSVLPVVGDDT